MIRQELNTTSTGSKFESSARGRARAKWCRTGILGLILACTPGEHTAQVFPLGDTAPPGDAGPPAEVQVLPLFPANGVNWNDYVLNDGPTAWDATDQPCTGTPADFRACLHGGEMRVVTLPGETSCSGLTLTADPDVFDWICEDAAGTGPVRFVSRGFYSNHGLGDWIDPAGAFRTGSVEVKRGNTPIAYSQPAIWGWTNSLKPLPDNPTDDVAILDEPGTIYFLATSRASQGYNLAADRVGLVVLPGQSLSSAESPITNCSFATGEVETDHSCLIAAGDQRFLWIEGVTEGRSTSPVDRGLLLVNVSFATINRFSTSANGTGIDFQQLSSSRTRWARAQGNQNHGVVINESSNNLFRSIGAANNGISGFRVKNAHENQLRYLLATDNREANGINFVDSDRNVVSMVVLTNNRGTENWQNNGIHVADSSFNTFTQVLSFNNENRGILVSSSTSVGNTFSHVSTFNHPSTGATVTNFPSQTTINQLLAANNQEYGLKIGNLPSGIQIHNIALLNNQTGVSITSTENSSFSGYLLVGSNQNAPCGTDGSVTPGLIDDTCTDTGLEGSNTYTGQASDAVLHVGRDITGAVVGKATDDLTNGDDSQGGAEYSTISDWLHFDNLFRGWGKDGAPFPDPSNAGLCTSDTCRIWDWRITANTAPSSSVAFVQNGWATGESCPPAVHGDTAIADAQEPPNTFLPHALEIFDDGIGDEDGLCESNEACVFTPHVGAYPGEGDCAQQSCVFADATGSGVTGVSMFACSIPGP